MTEVFRIPAPALFLAPLLIFYKYEGVRFEYGYEMMLFFIAAFLYILIGESDVSGFIAFLINLSCWVLFFNYIISNSIERMMVATYIFYSVLIISGLIMLIDHKYNIDYVRSILISGQVLQSPSGISTTIFSFGYQMAALSSFILAGIVLYKKKWILNLILITLAVLFIFFGMQRSVLVAFAVVGVLLMLFYYKAKSILLLCAISGLLLIGQNYMDQFTSDKNQQNILNKNVKQSNLNEERGDLITENLMVIVDYPFGLIFYNTSWNDVVQHNFVYKSGNSTITSHNAFLMFITYLGPLLGMILLILLHFKVCQIIWKSILEIKLRENALLVCLSCSFIATSINAFFHNDWLMTGNGPTIFLYFSILHLQKINANKPLLLG